MNKQQELQVVSLKREIRWQVYHRLQSLDIECECQIDQPLRINLDHPYAGIQLWSVVQQVTSSRCELVNWLDHCWWMKSYQ